MTVTTTINSITHLGNGSTTEFPYSYKLPSLTALQVSLRNRTTGVTTVVDPADYTVTGVGLEGGGTITYPLSGSPIDTPVELTATRIVPLTQTTSVTNQTAYNADVVEDVWDKQMMAIQQMQSQVDRALLAPPSGFDPLTAGDIFTIDASGYLIASDYNLNDIAGYADTAEDAAAAAMGYAAAAGKPYEDRAEAIASTVGASIDTIAVLEPHGNVLYYRRDTEGVTAYDIPLTTNGGTVDWIPLGPAYPQHWAENTTPGTTDMSDAVDEWLKFYCDGTDSGTATATIAAEPEGIAGALGQTVGISRSIVLGKVGTLGVGWAFNLRITDVMFKCLASGDWSDLETDVPGYAVVIADYLAADFTPSNCRLQEIVFDRSCIIDCNYQTGGRFWENTLNCEARGAVLNIGVDCAAEKTSIGDPTANSRSVNTRNTQLMFSWSAAIGRGGVGVGVTQPLLLDGICSVQTGGTSTLTLDGDEVSGGEWVSPVGKAVLIEARTTYFTEDAGATVTITGFADAARTVPLVDVITMRQHSTQWQHSYSSERFYVVTSVSVSGFDPLGKVGVGGSMNHRGLEIYTADAKISFCAPQQLCYGLIVDGFGSVQSTGFHPWSREVVIGEDCAYASIFMGTFFDFTDVYVKSFHHQLSGLMTAGNGTVRLVATEADTTGLGLSLGPFTCESDRVRTVVDHETEGSGTWVTDYLRRYNYIQDGAPKGLDVPQIRAGKFRQFSVDQEGYTRFAGALARTTDDGVVDNGGQIQFIPGDGTGEDYDFDQQLRYRRDEAAWQLGARFSGGGTGLIMMSPDHSEWKMTVDDDGDLSLTGTGVGTAIFNTTRAFSSRASLAAYIAAGGGFTAGALISDGTVLYLNMPLAHSEFGDDPISDLPGLAPYGVVTPDHFVENETPGTTDMGPAWASAIAYAKGLPGTGGPGNRVAMRVEFLPREYYIGTAVSVDSSHSRLQLIGNGALIVTDLDEPLLSIGDAATFTPGTDTAGTGINYNVEIDGFVFKSTNVTSVASVAIRAGKMSAWEIKNCEFWDFWVSIDGYILGPGLLFHNTCYIRNRSVPAQSFWRHQGGTSSVSGFSASGNGHNIVSNEVEGDPSNKDHLLDAFFWRSVDGVYFTNNHMKSCVNGLTLSPTGSDNGSSNNIITDFLSGGANYFDEPHTNGRNVSIEGKLASSGSSGNTTGRLKNVRFADTDEFRGDGEGSNGVVVSVTDQSGFVASRGGIEGVEVRGNFRQHRLQSVAFNGPVDSKIPVIKPKVSGNFSEGRKGGTTGGVSYIDADSKGITIHDCVFREETVAPSQSIAIRTDGHTDSEIILSNLDLGNSAATISAIFVNKDATDQVLATGVILPVGDTSRIPHKTNFATRAELESVAVVGGIWPSGAILSDGTVQYVNMPVGHSQYGLDPISDLPGLAPHGPVTPNHWKENTTPGTTDMTSAIVAAWNYDDKQDITLLGQIYDCASRVNLIGRGQIENFGPEGFSIKGTGRRTSTINFSDPDDGGIFISTPVVAFDASAVDTVNNTIPAPGHRMKQGTQVRYWDGGGTAPTGLTPSQSTNLNVIVVDEDTIALATSLANATSDTRIDITAVGAGTAHTVAITGYLEGTIEGFSIFTPDQNSGNFGLTMQRCYNCSVFDMLIDGGYDNIRLVGSPQCKFRSVRTSAEKSNKEGRSVWRFETYVPLATRSSATELISCDHAGTASSGGTTYYKPVCFYIEGIDHLTIIGGHYDFCKRYWHIYADGADGGDHVFETKSVGAYYDAGAGGSQLEHIYIEAPNGGAGAITRIEGMTFIGNMFRGGTGVLKLGDAAADVASLSKLEDITFEGNEIQDINGPIFEVFNTNLGADEVDIIRQIQINGNKYNDAGILTEWDRTAATGRTAAEYFAHLSGSGHTICSNSIEGGWDNAGDPVVSLRFRSSDCIVTNNVTKIHRTTAPFVDNSSGSVNLIAMNMWPDIAGVAQMEAPLRGDGIFGIVAETSGENTGALMEEGYDATNGYYVRYANGLQVCWKSGHTSGGAWTYEAAFAVAPCVSVNLLTAAARMTAASSITTTSCIPRTYNVSEVETNQAVQCIAVGVWKT